MKETMYSKEREKINVKDNGAYTMCMSVKCQSNVSQMTDKCQANVSIGKDRIGKVSIDKNRDIDAVITAWNSLPLSNIRDIRPKTARYSSLSERISDVGLPNVLEAIKSIGESDFLTGKNEKGWQCTFDWFINSTNFQKVIEGNYKNRAGTGKTIASRDFGGQRQYDYNDLMRKLNEADA